MREHLARRVRNTINEPGCAKFPHHDGGCPRLFELAQTSASPCRRWREGCRRLVRSSPEWPECQSGPGARFFYCQNKAISLRRGVWTEVVGVLRWFVDAPQGIALSWYAVEPYGRLCHSESVATVPPVRVPVH